MLIGIRDLAFLQSVLDHLDRDSRIDVVGAATEPHLFVRRAAAADPQAYVVCPSMAEETRHPAAQGRYQALFIAAEEMTVPVLREAIDAGAAGVFAWPEERSELAEVVARTRLRPVEAPPARGRVVAVFGSRGGSGTTFLATQLAASVRDGGRSCVLVDLDVDFADVSVALGIGPSQSVRTVADLLPVADELTPQHVEDALFEVGRGFAVLLAPWEPLEPSPALSAVYRAAVALLAGSFDVIVLHVPRSLNDLARVAVGFADEVILVVAPDLFSLYATRRAMGSMGLNAEDGRCRLVHNPALRGGISGADIERVLGTKPVARIRFDRSVPRTQDQGRLLPAGRGRAGRDVRSLARLVAMRSASPVPSDGPAGA